MCGLEFQVSPHSFFQTNTAQAEQLYLQVVRAVADAVGSGASAGNALGSGLVLDLYCGTGTIALCLAHRLKSVEVVGFDVSASSIADAEANAARNGLSNVRFVRGDLNQLLPDGPAAKQGAPGSKPSKDAPRKAPGVLQQLQPKVVVVDPARAGLGRGVVQYLLQCGAQRVVYVSCNAATQARDLQLLCGRGMFRLSSWTCVDLFPQTDVAHVETVVVLDRV
jgi:tRNA/tmRNA/rRNA uracil-C5-methylase (TrmA/RlmC/RlmD family)